MIITIDKSICENIEALQYEVESRKDVIIQALSGSVKMKSDMFDDYHKKYQEFFKQYNQAKSEMIKKYLSNEDGKKAWSLDFSSCELTVED